MQTLAHFSMLLAALLLGGPIGAQQQAGYLLWEFDTGG